MGNEIEILSEVDAIRQSPWMYIGSVCDEGAHHLLFELVHNSMDEAILGFCDKLKVSMGNGFCEVEDNGRGIPTEIHSKAKVSSCEVALTRLHAGSKFRKQSGLFTAGLHGVGLACVNALASDLSVTVIRKGKRYVQAYKRGVATAPLAEIGTAEGSGTKIRFIPDVEIFQGFSGFSDSRCGDFLENLAYLNPGLEVTYENQMTKKKQVFFCERDGSHALLRKYLEGRRVLFPDPIKIALRSDDLQAEALFSWGAESEPSLQSFVNCVHTVHGGTHLSAFRAGLARAVNRFAEESGRGSWKEPAEMDEVTDGLVAVLNCKVASPSFEGQTKSRFTQQGINTRIEKATAEQALDFFRSNTRVAGVVLDRVHDARNARAAAKRAADRVYLQHGRKDINEAVYKEQFGARSKNWHDSAVWITHNELLQSHSSLCKVDENSIALDVCCGSGVVGASFKGKVKKVIGLDLTPEMVKLASNRLDEVVQGNVYNIPFADNSFDLVCTREVLHLLPYPERPVSEIFRVLKPGGQFIVGQILPFCEDDAAWMYRVFKKKQPLIYNMFQEEDFRRLLLSPGFVDMEMKELNVWESIDVWINSHETTAIHRHEIRELFRNAPAEARASHPFKILPNGEIQDLWRWCVFSVRKPG